MTINVNKITSKQKLIIEKGLCDYVYIMKYWKKMDEDFKEVYYNFYLKARWAVMQKKANSLPYFQKLQDLKPTESLIDVVNYLHENMENHSYEFSFATKLIHTRNPLSPIYDSKVRKYLAEYENIDFWWQSAGLPKRNKIPRGKTDIEKIEHDWIVINKWYENTLNSKRGKEWILWFDANFPTHTNISDVKKIDFIIFAVS